MTVTENKLGNELAVNKRIKGNLDNIDGERCNTLILDFFITKIVLKSVFYNTENYLNESFYSLYFQMSRTAI